MRKVAQRRSSPLWALRRVCQPCRNGSNYALVIGHDDVCNRRAHGKTGGVVMKATKVRRFWARPSAVRQQPVANRSRCLPRARRMQACRYARQRPFAEFPGISAKPSAGDNIDIFDPNLHSGATVIHAIDPHTLSDSQVKFGVAPKRDPSVEYQPDIILMEERR